MSLAEKYFYADEKDIREVYDRVAYAISGGDKDLAERLYWYMVDGWYSPATPILLNMGTDLADGISCFLTTPNSDSLSDIFLEAHEMATLSKSGGGIGCDVSKIRGAGSPIKGGSLGFSHGIAPFAKLYEASILASAQNKSRRGSAALYLDITHPDIELFLTLRETKGDMSKKTPDLFTGVIIPDQFMEDVLHNREFELIDPHSGPTGRYIGARDIFVRIIKTRHETGLPYIFFPDVANRMCLPEGQKEKGLKITTSSLCVAPETQILTSNGYKEMVSLENQFIDVWNGEEWSNVQVVKTGENQELIKVTTECGREIECTPYHKFYIHGGKTSPTKTSNLRYKVKEVRAEELKEGDKLIKFEMPVVQGKETLSSAYEQGFFTGDGCFDKSRSNNIIYLYGNKRKLINKFPLKSYHNIQEDQNREILHYPNLLPKDFVPDTKYTVKSRLEWLAGYLDADGCLTDNKGSQSFQIASINKESLKKIQLMLQTLGVQSKVVFRRENGKFLLPKNDGSGENGLYNCKEVNMLCIGHFGITKLLELGLELFRLKPTYRVSERYKNSVEQFIKIKSVERTGRISDTYCVNEPKRHKVVFNGLLTGNCSEIVSITNHNRSGTCILSCINLAKWDEFESQFEQLVEDIVTSLDNVAESFIQRNSHIAGKEKAVFSTWASREIGIGWAGFHDYILDKGWAFDSIQARGFDITATKRLKKASLQASKKLAEKRGDCSDAPGYRNARLLTMMPTASTSQLLNTSKSIEPYQSPSYTLKSDTGNRIIKLRQLERIIGKDNPLWLNITQAGSVQNIPELNDGIKNIFKNAFEISQKSIISMASERQKAMSGKDKMTHTQSVNLFYSKGASLRGMVEDVLYAWENNVPSLYYCITTKNSYNQSECFACQS